MKILVVLTYYRPHTSGLTIYTERLAKALVKRGHQVTVLTSHYDHQLPTHEINDGIKIVRAPVLMRISKGVMMPTFGILASRLVLQCDVISLHLPQLDAAGLALRGRILNKPTIVTYHCDLKMPPGVLSWIANQVVNFTNHLAARFTHRIVAYTQDYALHSPFLNRYSKKLKIIPPPVQLPSVTNKEFYDFKYRNNKENKRPVIGFAARFASEKGIEVLLNSLDNILTVFPDSLVWFAGPYKNIIGEEQYLKRLLPRIKYFENSGHWKFLGTLQPEEMSCFYPNLDVLVVPSLNSTESFGLVQIEAMMNGVPVLASNLPGVRQPLKMHKMGTLFPAGNSKAFSRAMIDLLKNAKKTKYIQKQIMHAYSPDFVAESYENLFMEIQQEIKKQL